MHKWLEDYDLSSTNDTVRIIINKIQEQHEELLKEIRGEQVLEEKETSIIQQITPEPETISTELLEPNFTPPETSEPVSIPEAIAPLVAETKIESVVSPTPKPAPLTKKTVPKPKRPPVDWKKVRERIGEAAASGALLRALLYLSAFMIVVSATVLVVRFWTSFPQILQLVFIAAVPISFYAGGWLLRSKLKLIQAGSVLTGIGAILVAVDFAAIYQFGGLAEQIIGPIYWLAVSIFCTALYAFTAWKIHGEFFNYLTLIGGGSVLFTLTRVPPLSMEWSITSVTFSSTLMAVFAGRFWQSGVKRHEIARASRYLSQILIPLSIFYIIFSPSKPPVEQTVAFLVATVGYGILAWQFPSLIFAYASLGTSIGMVIFGLLVFNVPLDWYPTTASILAFLYILISQVLKRAKPESGFAQIYPKALNATGLTLIGLTILGGCITALNDIWPAVIALTIASFDLAFCAYIFQKSRYTAFAAGLFIIPFSLGFWRWFTDQNIAQSIGWMTFAWGGLALAYVGGGVLLKKYDRHAGWLFGIGHFFNLFALFVLPFDSIPNTAAWKNTPTLFSLAICFAVYTASFILQDSGNHPPLSKISNWLPRGLGKAIFLWPMGLILPIWISTAWYGNGMVRKHPFTCVAWRNHRGPGTCICGHRPIAFQAGQRIPFPIACLRLYTFCNQYPLSNK